VATKRESIRVAADEGQALVVVGIPHRIKLTGAETEGAYTAWIDTVPPGSGPPPHVHHREDEDFFILEGEFEIFREGEPPLRASAGDLVHSPRGAVHTYRNVGTTVGRMFQVAVPAGIEHFFAEVGQPGSGEGHAPHPPTAAEVEYLIRTAEKYGIEIKLPPDEAPPSA
jgi:mannose-6-phosphate isomerase-like protein (cupin superfamily)